MAKNGIQIRDNDGQLFEFLIQTAKQSGRDEVLMEMLRHENQQLKQQRPSFGYSDMPLPLPLPSSQPLALPPAPETPLMLPAADTAVGQHQPMQPPSFAPPTVFEAQAQTVLGCGLPRINYRKWLTLGGALLTGVSIAGLLVATPTLPWLNQKFDQIEQQPVMPNPQPVAPEQVTPEAEPLPVPQPPPPPPAQGDVEASPEPEAPPAPSPQQDQIDQLWQPPAPVVNVQA